MWKSWSDKWDVIPHDNKNYPRKVKTNTVAVITLIILFICNTYTFQNLLPSGKLTDYLSVGSCLSGFIVFSILALLKWVKNNKEIDICLFIGIIASGFGFLYSLLF